MRLLKKIFFKFFLLKIVFILFFYSKIIFANNANETNLPILERLPTSIFATVNNEPISVYDLIQRANLFSISSKIPINKEFEIRILPDLISGQIDEVIQMQEIKRENIFISENQIDEIIKKIEQDNGFDEGKFGLFLKENKTEISILRKQVEASIGWRQLVANKFRGQVVIQDSEVQTVLKNIKSSVGKDEFLLEQIFVSFETRNENEALNKINKLYSQIETGGEFNSIAEQFSDSFGGKKGQIGWMSEIDIDEKIINQVKKLEKNSISKPLKGQDGYFIIKVLNKRIIGEEVINEISLFKIQLKEKKEETINILSKIKNCSELEDFSNEHGTDESGSLGMFNFAELSQDLKSVLKKMEKNEITDNLNFGGDEFQIMVCDIKKFKPIVPSEFKIRDILTNKKLDTIARNYMSELRSKAIIDIRI
mgnify:CR=1 FL=1